MSTPRPLAGLAALAGDADAFILDLWGVVHGGVRPFPGVVETLTALRAAGKAIAFVSNAPVRAHHVARQLDTMGLGGAYDALATSGEVTWAHVTANYDGAAYYGIGPDWARLLHEDLAHRRVERLYDAGFLLVVGLDERRPRPGDYASELQAAKGLGLPLVCANPDRVIVVQDGTYSWCAGALADAYAALGGRVDWLGKPDPTIFADAAAAVGVDDPARVVVVGDGLATDIKGANAYGCRSVLVTRGIHARDLGIAAGAAADAAAVAALAERHGARPDYVMATLAW
ncbi:MAG: TIGR01459 family HAD-type hydrolase [Alphaproteobacteria bacterium]